MKKILISILTLTLVVCLLLTLTACSGSAKIKSGFKTVEKHMRNTILDFKVLEATGGALEISEVYGVYAEGDDNIYYYITVRSYNQYGTYQTSDDYYYSYNTSTKSVSEADKTTYWLMHGQYELQEDGNKRDKKYYYAVVRD